MEDFTIMGQANVESRIARRKNNKKKTIRKLVSKFIYTMIILFVICFVCGIGAVFGIRNGLVPSLKDYIVTSAMTTLNHKYIAEIVATPSQIKEIMERNRIDENYDKQNTGLITPDQGMEKENTVKLVDISRDGYKGYLLEISNPKKVFIGVSSQLGTRGTKIASLINDYGSVAGINAGGFTDAAGHGTGGLATGIIISGGEIKYKDDKISKYNIIGFNRKDVLVLGTYTLDELKKLDLRDAVDFHPFLIINGIPTKVHGNGGWGSGPRTAIGQRADGTVLMVVVDGRQLSSIGATMKQMQDIMIEHGAVNAANLDGGSSTVMYYGGKIVNSPCSIYGDRFLPSAFLIAN